MDTVKYIDVGHTQILVEPEGWLLSLPLPPHRQAMIDEWVALGNEIQNFSLPFEAVFNNKLTEIEANFEIEANADVVSNGQTWAGGATSAMLMDGKSNAMIHRGRPSGTIHSKDHRAHIMNTNEIKDVASDIADAYDTAYIKLQAKLLEIESCGNDTACLSNIKWSI